MMIDIHDIIHLEKAVLLHSFNVVLMDPEKLKSYKKPDIVMP